MYEELLIPIEDVSFYREKRSPIIWSNLGGEVLFLAENYKNISWSWRLSHKGIQMLEEKDFEKVLEPLYTAKLNQHFSSRKEAMQDCINFLNTIIPNHNVSQQFLVHQKHYFIKTLEGFGELNYYKGIIIGSTTQKWKFSPTITMQKDFEKFKNQFYMQKYMSRSHIIYPIYEFLNQQLGELYDASLYQQVRPILLGQDIPKTWNSPIIHFIDKAWWSMFTKPEIDLTTVFS